MKMVPYEAKLYNERVPKNLTKKTIVSIYTVKGRAGIYFLAKKTISKREPA